MKAATESVKLCPRCGNPGSGPYAREVRNSRGEKYTANYFAHSGAHEGGKHKIRWCYLTAEHMLALAATRGE